MQTINKQTLVDDCITKSLASMDPDLFKNAVVSVIWSYPDVALALDKKALLESIQLNPEYLSGSISAALNDPDARLVMLKNLVNLDKIDPNYIP